MKERCRSLLLFLLLSCLLSALLSCQSFPKGERVSDLREESSGAAAVYTTADLYFYFTLCRVVWRDREKWRETGWELDYFYDEPTNTLGLAVERDGVLHIAFRSSQALETGTDLSYNSKIILRKVPFLEDTKIRAHGGFLKKYSAIREELHKRIEGADHVVLVGHSGGGAMTNIAYLDLAVHYPDLRLEAVVFGPVRTYNRHGAAWFEENDAHLVRIVNGRDPFSNLPPSFFGYRHVGRLVRVGRRPWYKLFSFRDHHPGYRTVLEELLLREGIEPSKFNYY